MRAIDFGPSPLQAVSLQTETVEEGGSDGHGVKRRAVVVQKAGHDGLARASAAADLVGRLQHRDLRTLFCEGDGGSEPVGPAPDHHRSCHATAPNRGSAAGRVHVTCNGIGPLGSQGCSATASVTFQVPRSITPSAASMTL